MVRKAQQADGRRRRRWLLPAALAAIAVGWFLLRPAKGQKRGAASPQALMPRIAAKRGVASFARVAQQVTAPPAKTPLLPVIDALTVQKQEVCRGEENLLTVKAHTTDATDAFLSAILLDAKSRKPLRGAQIPFRLDQSTPLKILIEGKHGSRVVAGPVVRVKDCDAPYQITIDVQRHATAPDRASLHARLLQVSAGEPFVPVSYDWDFGDGQTQVTTSPDVEHSYEARRQDVAHSSFLVSVALKDASGAGQRGSLALSFANVAFQRLAFNDTVVLSIGVREAVSGGAHEELWLYHGYSRAVHIEHARLRETVLNSDGSERETFARAYDPEALLGAALIPAQRSVILRDLTELQPIEPGAVRYVELEGHSEDGKAVVGAFTLLPAKPQAQANMSGEDAHDRAN